MSIIDAFVFLDCQTQDRLHVYGPCPCGDPPATLDLNSVILPLPK